MLKLIYLDSSRSRRERLAKHFAHRFEVRTASTLAEAERLFAQEAPNALVSYFQMPDGDAFQLATKLRLQSDATVFLVHGSPELRSKRRVSSDVVDVYSAELLSPSLMEGLVWNAIVQRHSPSGRNRRGRPAMWSQLLKVEPLLKQVQPLVNACKGNGDPLCLAGQLQTLLHTRHTTSAKRLPFVAVVEDEQEKREAMQAHFSGRLRLYFVVHPRDLVSLQNRQAVSAIVFQVPGATASLIHTLRSMSDLHVPMVAHGLPRRIPVDRQVDHPLALPALEALLWEELTRADPRVLLAHRSNGAMIHTQSASLSEAEVVRRSTWGDLLTAEVSFTNLKRLFMKEIRIQGAVVEGPEPGGAEATERPLSELTWSELLSSNVSRDSLREMFSREIHLFPQR
ncbi:MAG: hypothetical protein CL927_12690 [Deltaproteobacteria bacterium]|nr:hypothetical protein [Deltaproteobacteria bacterium]HCH66581.1 hypothetical protein [Deltaproteobacteria bacterium]